MKTKTTILLVIFTLFATFISAQEYYPKSKKEKNQVPEGKITYHQDRRVDSIVSQHIRYNQTVKTFDGYRIQIYFDAGNNSLRGAQTVADRYQMLYPGDTAYISFNAPYYKVRVGDFRTRMDAEGFLHQLLPDFPNAFIIKDQILSPKLEQ